MISKIVLLLLLLSITSCTTRSQLRQEIEKNDEELRVSEKALRDAIQKKKVTKRKVQVIEVPIPVKDNRFEGAEINE